MKCELCGLEFEPAKYGRPKKYCSLKCGRKKQSHAFYLKHKEKYAENAKKWAITHPERRREITKKAFNKFLTEKPKRFKRLLWHTFERKKAKKAGTFDTAEERSDLAKSPVARTSNEW